MLLGHVAVGLAARRAVPSMSLGTWMLAVLLVDLIWPIFLLAGIEQVRIVPGITAFTPLEFTYYPWTHSLVASVGWGLLLAGVWRLRGAGGPALWLLGAAVVSHWMLDAVAHRPDMPVLPGGPMIGLGLWYSVPATLAVELLMYAAGLWLYIRSGAAGARRPVFWLLIAVLVAAYFGAAFGPPPPDTTTLALSALALWPLVLWAAWADRDGMRGSREQRSAEP